MKDIMELGKYIQEREAYSPLKILVKSPKNPGRVITIDLVLDAKKVFDYTGVTIQEFKSGYQEKYLYRRGSSRGPDKTLSAILLDPSTTFRIKILGWFQKNWQQKAKTQIIYYYGYVTRQQYSFYILGTPSVNVGQLSSTVYSGENFVHSLTITNTESISLNLSLLVLGTDDEILQGNGSQIILAPGESQTIVLKIKPKHASIHQLLIRLYHGEDVYYQYTLEFNVEPQWMSPRFYIPFIILPILVILLIAGFAGFSFYFLRTRERIRQVFLEEFSSTKEPVSLSKVQSSLKAPSFMVNLGISSDQNLIVTPDGKIISKEHLTQHIAQIISSSTGPSKLLDISIKYPFSMSQVLSIVSKALSEGKINGKVVDNVFYPADFIFQVSSFISNQISGNLSSLFDKFQINQKIINIAVNNLLESDDSIFTIYLHPQQDIFQVIYISEWNNIVRELSSSEGFTPGSVFPRLDIYNWRSIFQNQRLTILSYRNQLFTIDALQAYTPEHLDEITPIIQNVRRQLPQLSLTSRKQREIIQSFELLLPIEPVHLPYFCQMDSAMIVKEQAAYVCVECNRKICPSCYNAMLQTGMVTCIHCNGDLVERPALQIEIDIERVDQMSGHDFENFLEGLFRTQMYRVENIQSSGDHGVDLVVVKGESRTGVQAKRYKPNSKIGNKVLVTLKGGGYFHDCDKLMVVTTSFFTPKAKEYAQKVGIELWDRDILRRYLTKYNEHLQDISK